MLYDAYGRQLKRSIGFVPEYRAAVPETSTSVTADAQSDISFEAEEIYEASTSVTPEN